MDLKELLDRAEYTINYQRQEIDKLRAEIERLRATGGAHSVLKSIYLNGDLPESLRAKAATAALPHETPKLMPERAPLELKVEPQLSLRERCQEALVRHERLGRELERELKAGEGRFKVVNLLPGKSNGSGSDDGSDNSEPGNH